MFGYIRPSKPHLSEQDEARFQSVYCGLCHELGRKYGFAARFVLYFYFTFLAILLSDAQEPECESCRCAAHPCKAQCVMAHTVALETAADHSLVLAWWQLRDHIEDHGFFKAIPYRLAALLLRGAYRKARTFVPEFDASVQRHLNDLHEREREHCASLDQAAEPFAAGRSSDEPAALVYKATWPEERVVRCTVGTLADAGAREGIDRTALVVVGRVLGARGGLAHNGEQAGSNERRKHYDPSIATGNRKSRS